MALRVNVEDKLNQQRIAISCTYKTTEDFLYWLREKKAVEKQVAERVALFDRRAVMVWVDDGGRTIAAADEAREPARD